jgi:hypothetical protein
MVFGGLGAALGRSAGDGLFCFQPGRS